MAGTHRYSERCGRFFGCRSLLHTLAARLRIEEVSPLQSILAYTGNCWALKARGLSNMIAQFKYILQKLGQLTEVLGSISAAALMKAMVPAGSV